MKSEERPCLGLHLSSAHRRSDRHFNRVYAPLKLGHAQAQLLLCLLDHGPLRVSDLSVHTGLGRSATSRLLAELSRRRLVKRARHPGDRRAVLLEPASRAHDIADELRRLRARANERLYRDLPPEDAEALVRALSVLNRLP